ncbi:glycogen/starch synthase [Hydrogenimonas sp. SS33]|uniref:glycogen synthase n=1 Tax=Hydrogenimonas leucolamina TaxID=2954236 RepID=UPI00336C0943
MRVLFAAAELFPFAKTGGLADIAHALPKALSKSLEVTVAMPLYRFIDQERFGIEPTGRSVAFEMGGAPVRVALFRCIYEGVEHLFFYEERLCDVDAPYGPPYEANDIRFAVFCHALVALGRNERFDLIHLNDWHTALAAPLMKDRGLPSRVVYTIHNLAYQGIFPKSSLERTGLAAYHFAPEDMEFYGQVNWMKGGIAHADAVTTVSPSYAVEIQTTAFGCGLEGFIRKHAGKLKGILNGIDTDFYHPETDAALAAHYSPDRLEGKSLCKKAFLNEIDMKKYEDPLFIFIGRFVEQKGLDLLVEAVEAIARRPMTLAILGEGEERWHTALGEAAESAENIHLRFGYDENLSHRMYAAADFLLMPSRFEPCGLNQMIAMRYGTLPVVHRVGGLRDTVHESGREWVCGMGYVFDDATPDALVDAIDRALALYDRPASMDKMKRFDMRCDFSIERCAKAYEALYRGLVRR